MKHSCESVLESFVSRYENHFDVRRSVDEETANEEFVTVNGPNLANCKGVVREEAMEDYWKAKHAGSWHFVQNSVLEQLQQLQTVEDKDCSASHGLVKIVECKYSHVFIHIIHLIPLMAFRHLVSLKICYSTGS